MEIDRFAALTRPLPIKRADSTDPLAWLWPVLRSQPQLFAGAGAAAPWLFGLTDPRGQQAFNNISNWATGNWRTAAPAPAAPAAQAVPAAPTAPAPPVAQALPPSYNAALGLAGRLPRVGKFVGGRAMPLMPFAVEGAGYLSNWATGRPQQSRESFLQERSFDPQQGVYRGIVEPLMRSADTPMRSVYEVFRQGLPLLGQAPGMFWNAWKYRGNAQQIAQRQGLPAPSAAATPKPSLPTT